VIGAVDDDLQIFDGSANSIVNHVFVAGCLCQLDDVTETPAY